MLNAEQLLNDIRDANLSFLVLAQAMIREDADSAKELLGMSEHVAELIGQLSPQQVVRMASRNLTLCTLRVEDDIAFSLLTDRHTPAMHGRSMGMGAGIAALAA